MQQRYKSEQNSVESGLVFMSVEKFNLQLWDSNIFHFKKFWKKYYFVSLKLSLVTDDMSTH